jgi:hypothetical protein
MTAATDMTWLLSQFRVMEDCCLHDPAWTPAEAAQVLVQETGSWEDWTDEIIIVTLTDGDLGLLTSSADYTGHGCRCRSMTAREPTLARLLAHLTEKELMAVIKQDRA